MIPRLRTMAILGTLVVAACSLTGCNADSVSWVFVSNPSGSEAFPEGGAVLVVRVTSTTTSGAPAATTGQRTLRFEGDDDRGTVVVHLPTGGDVALLERARGVEVRSILLPGNRAELDGARLALPQSGAAVADITVPDPAAVVPGTRGPGRLLIAATGTLLALEHRDGADVWGADGRETFPAGTRIDTSGGDATFQAFTPDGRIRVLRPAPPPTVEQRLRRPAEGQLEILGPAGRVLARVPANRIDVRGGLDGVFLTGSFPSGTGGVPRPFALTMADRNRYLVRTDF